MDDTSISIQDSQQTITIEDIQKYLNNTFACIRSKHYSVSMDEYKRSKNVGFSRRYGMEPEDYEEMFLSLKPENFAHAVQNWKNEDETLYVFRLDTELLNIVIGEYEPVTIYIKVFLLEHPYMYCTYISCHEADESKEFDYYQF